MALRFRARRGVFFMALVAAACAGRDGGVVAPRASSAVVAPSPSPTREAVDPSATLTLVQLRTSPGLAAEDGRGQVAFVTLPVAIDVTRAEPWPARAQDPVLSIGSLRFARYSYEAPNTLRFIATSRELLREGGDVSVQYGRDTASRVVIARAWQP